MSLLNIITITPQTVKPIHHKAKSLINKDEMEKNFLVNNYPHINSPITKSINPQSKQSVNNTLDGGNNKLPPLFVQGQKQHFKIKTQMINIKNQEVKSDTIDTSMRKSIVSSDICETDETMKSFILNPNEYDKKSPRAQNLSPLDKSKLILDVLENDSNILKEKPAQKYNRTKQAAFLDLNGYSIAKPKYKPKLATQDSRYFLSKTIDNFKDIGTIHNRDGRSKLCESIGQIITNEIGKNSPTYKKLDPIKNLYHKKTLSLHEKRDTFAMLNQKTENPRCLVNQELWDINNSSSKKHNDNTINDQDRSRSKDSLNQRNSVYTIDSNYDYSIKVNEEYGKELLEIESHRSKKEENKMEKLLKIREKFRDKYLCEEKQPITTSPSHRISAITPNHNLIKYENQVMPFSLGVLAKVRKTLVKEIKTINGDPKVIESRKHRNHARKIQELKNIILPEEEAKYINEVNEQQKRRRFCDLKCKGSSSNAYYSFFALDNDSKKKIKQKLEEILPQTSRFRDLE